MPEEMVSVIEGETMGTPATPARQISHWLGPLLTALGVVGMLGGWLVTVGAYSQRLTNVEMRQEKTEQQMTPRTEFDLQNKNVMDKLDKMDGKLDRLQERRR